MINFKSTSNVPPTNIASSTWASLGTTTKSAAQKAAEEEQMRAIQFKASHPKTPTPKPVADSFTKTFFESVGKVDEALSPSWLTSPAFDLGNEKPGIGTIAKTAANQGKSFVSNTWGLLKGLLMAPFTTPKTIYDIKQEIDTITKEREANAKNISTMGNTIKNKLEYKISIDALNGKDTTKLEKALAEITAPNKKLTIPEALGQATEMVVGATGDVLLPPAVKKGILAGKQGVGEGIYQGVKSLAEDPFQLLPYGLVLKGILDKSPTKVKKEIDTIKQESISGMEKAYDVSTINDLSINGKFDPRVYQGRIADITARLTRSGNTNLVKPFLGQMSAKEFSNWFDFKYAAEDALTKISGGEVVPISKIKDPEILRIQNELVGKIVQGKLKDIPAAARALKGVDPVADYNTLNTNLAKQVKSLAEQVDVKLDTNPTPIKMPDMNVSVTVGDKVVSTNYVKIALEGLKEAYAKSNDAVNAERVNQMLQKADTTGLSPKEINYVAREYGSEFKSKAFGKAGEPLTSTTAQGYENIRKGVKATARQYMPDETTVGLDKQMSDIYNTLKATQKMEEGVNRLNQRLIKRGSLQQIGNFVGVGLDLTTGGILKGFLKSMMFDTNPKSKAGNALTIEKTLENNLRALEEINNASSEADFVNKVSNYIKNNRRAFMVAGGLEEIDQE